MYFSITGKITYVNKDYIVVESNGIGYQITVANPSNFIKNEFFTIYLYRVVKEDDEYFVGFQTIEERDAFIILNSVKGIGPKTALGILGYSNVKTIFTAIASNNLAFLRKLPGIGKKQASQILLDLQGSFVLTTSNIKQYDEVRNALRNMGFKIKIIDSVLSEINLPNATNEDILKEALKRMRK